MSNRQSLHQTVQAPYFVEYIRHYLEEKYGATTLYRGGLKVYTTIDLEAQKKAEHALKWGLEMLDKRQGFRPLVKSVNLKKRNGEETRGILESFEAVLGDDYALVMVDNVPDALTLLRKHKPRLLFLDLKIPKFDGFYVLKWLREEGLTTAVVVVTGLAQDHYEALARQYGVYRYLRKPLDVDEIENITRRVFH